MGWPWTPPELAFLRERVDARDSAADIAEAMSRTAGAVSHKIKDMKLRTPENMPSSRRRFGPAAQPKPERVPRADLWAPEEKERARVMWEVEGLSGREIGAVIGRSRSSVLRMANKSGWRQHKADKDTQALIGKTTRRDRPKRKPPANVLKFGGVRMSPDIKPPTPPAPVEPALENAVTLGARTSRMCCFPVGEAGGADQLFCGGDKARGDYCAFHHGVMYARRAA